MSQILDLVIRNVRLLEAPAAPVNIGIQNGHIVAVTTDRLRGTEELYGDGNLIVGSFVDCHLHLCKSYTLDQIGDEALRRYADDRMRDASTAIDLAASVKASYTVESVYERARRAVLEGLKHGVTHMQGFLDTDTAARLTAIDALIRLREEFKGRVTLRLVAFPQQGLLRDPGAQELVKEALRRGADVVGGIPWIEETPEDVSDHIEKVFALAREFDRDVAMLVDDAGDPALRTTEMLAAAAMRHGWSGRVTACHARAMALYPDPYFKALLPLFRDVGMKFVSDPHTGSLHLRFAELLEAGVPVALGQDDIADAYYPYGRHNMLEVAFLASHIAGPPTFAQMRRCLDMVTRRAAWVFGLQEYGIDLGRPANLVVLQGATLRDVLTEHAAPLYVVSHGRLQASTTSQTIFPDVGASFTG